MLPVSSAPSILNEQSDPVSAEIAARYPEGKHTFHVLTPSEDVAPEPT